MTSPPVPVMETSDAASATVHQIHLTSSRAQPEVEIAIHKKDAATPDDRTEWAQWRAFTAAWDCLLVDLREADLLSNKETTHLALHDSSPCADWLAVSLNSRKASESDISQLAGTGEQANGVLGPVLLPGLVHQGVLQDLVDGGGSGSGSMQVQVTLKKLRAVGIALLAGCGFAKSEEACSLCNLGMGWRAVPRVAEHQEARQALLGTAQQLAALLISACSAGEDGKSRSSALTELARCVHASLKCVLKGLEVECKAANSKQWPSASLEKHLKVLSSIQKDVNDLTTEAVAVCLARLCTPEATLTTPNPEAVPDRHKRDPSGAGGAPAAAAVAALDAVAESATAAAAAAPGALLLVRYFDILVNSSKLGAKPRSVDANRAITLFLNSLAMDSLTSAPSLVSCPSLTTLTPVYAEEVIYALNPKQLAASLLDVKAETAADPSTSVARPVPPSGPTQRSRQVQSVSGSRLPGNAVAPARPSGGGATSMADLKAERAVAAAGLTDLLTDGVNGGLGHEGSNVSLITYLMTIYSGEFDNFKERIVAKAGLPPEEARRITPIDFATSGALSRYALDLQLWASYRGQLLARTVRGMECYHKAIRLLAALEYPDATPQDQPWLDQLASVKFQHLVSAQVYGNQRKSKDLRDRWNAKGIDLLMRRHPALRVAYVDASGKNQPSYSVLLRARGADSLQYKRAQIEEVYRVRLPTNPYSGRGIIIGEGKPENQNHAIIFCITEAIQSIDANQDNTVSEALKIRNVLKELNLHGSDEQVKRLKSVTKKPESDQAGKVIMCEKALRVLRGFKAADKPTAIVGLREWIFSNRVGALGGFAAATEYAFSTIIQRNMACGGVRLHYGHPDIFNRLHIMTRGGLSKSTRGLHVSEDVFAGLSHLNRGAEIKQVEHSSVGKGRDMGLDSILGFEFKISAGNAQVFLSRDLARVSARLDLFRLLHFYYSGLGYFTTAMLTVAAISVQLVTSVALALAGITVIVQANPADPTNPTVVPILYGTPLAILTGLVANTPWIAQTLLDQGFITTILQTVEQVLQGSLMFYAFRLQTTAIAFASALSYPGGAQYVATGRGFAYQRRSFIHLYSRYGRSHLQPGVFLTVLLILLGGLVSYQGYDIRSYAALTWPMWIQAFSLVMAAFWFTPESFSWSKVRRDWNEWRRWQLGREQDSAAGGSWATWNRKELESVRNWHGRQTDTAGTAALGVIMGALPPLLLGFLAVLQLLSWGKTGTCLVCSVGLWGLFAFLVFFRSIPKNQGKERCLWLWKSISNALILVAVLGYCIVLATVLGGYGALPLVFTAILHVSFAMLVHQVALHVLPALRFAWLVDGGFWILDTAVGGFLLCITSLLCLGGVMTRLQAVLLLNTKYIQVAKGGKMAKELASRQGGLAAASPPPAPISATAAARDAAAAKDAALVLENAADVVESHQNDITTTILAGSAALVGGVSAVIGAARHSGRTASVSPPASPAVFGQRGATWLGSWLRGLGDGRVQQDGGADSRDADASAARRPQHAVDPSGAQGALRSINPPAAPLTPSAQQPIGSKYPAIVYR